MLEILIIIPIFALHVAEAVYEAERGDLRHYPTFWGQFVLSCFVGWAVPFSSILGGIFAFIAVRIWFDYIYNYAKGLHWSYVGKYAETDKLIRLLEKRFGAIKVAYALLFVRAAVSLGAIILITKV